MTAKDKLIKDLIIKVKAGDLESAAKSAEKLSTSLENAAAGGELVDSAVSKLPSTLRNALNVANDFKKVMSAKLGNSLVGQFGGVGYILAGMGFPKDANGNSPTGTNLFGLDYYYTYVRDAMFLVVSCTWYDPAAAGVWGVGFSNNRTYTYVNRGARSACYHV